MIDPLPEGFVFIATGLNGIKQWTVQAPRVHLQTPTGDIEMGVIDGRAYIRSFNMQGSMVAGGVDNTIMFFFGEEPKVKVKVVPESEHF